MFEVRAIPENGDAFLNPNSGKLFGTCVMLL